MSQNSLGQILLVEDEPAILKKYVGWCSEFGYTVETAVNPQEALDKFHNIKVESVLLDLALPPSLDPQDGLKLISRFAPVPVIVVTGHSERELAVKAMLELGAADFLEKPVNSEMLKVVLNRTIYKHRLEIEVKTLRQISLPDDDLGLVGKSQDIKKLRELIRKIAAHDTINVSITGKSGTGKELVARAIHKLSERRSKPFIPVHCGALPETLFESELFGHTKGSFTGADRDKEGLVAAAEGGVLFLDEIGEMPPLMQVKLLRFLQDGKYYAVGSTKERKSDVRIISATNRDLEKMIKEGSFREDLFYRIKGFQIRTASLKERIEDIPVIAAKIVARCSQGKKRLANNVYPWLMEQPWTGNVRELQIFIENATLLAGYEKEISLDDLHFASDGSQAVDKNTLNEISLEEQVNAFEKGIIISTLENAGRKLGETADRLGIHRHTLTYKMKKLNINLE